MSMKDRFKTDSTAARDGVWFDYPANSDGSVPKFKLARASAKQNKKYAIAVRKLASQHVGENGELDFANVNEEAADKALLDIFIDTILLDWSDFQPDDDGVKMPFSRENAVFILGSPDWVDLYSDLSARAAKASNYRAKALEAQAKN